MLNLSVFLEDSAANLPDRDAVVLGPTRLTYAQVDGAANQIANLLVSRGIRPGDKVALSCPNLPYFPIVYYGILKAGAVVVPLNVLLKGREAAYHLADSDAKAFFCFQGTTELVIGAEGCKGFNGTDTAVILYTSGTTGQPKGAELSHSNMVTNALTCHRLFGEHPDGYDTHLVTLPLFHSFGQTVQLNAGFGWAPPWCWCRGSTRSRRWR